MLAKFIWVKLNMVELKMSKTINLVCTGVVDASSPRLAADAQELVIRVHQVDDAFILGEPSRRGSAQFNSHKSEQEYLHFFFSV